MTEFRQYRDGDYFADVDGKRITRKSVFDARVYSDDYASFNEYKSRIEHCSSCLQDAEFETSLDQCCCIHSEFKSKKEENAYVKSVGFWNIPFNVGVIR